MTEKHYKIVNGERIEITGDELTALQAEWKAFNDSVPAMELEQLRSERNQMLASSDWVVVKAQEKGTEVPSSWITYRQELRDITKTYKTLEEVKWPIKPSD